MSVGFKYLYYCKLLYSMLLDKINTEQNFFTKSLYHNTQNLLFLYIQFVIQSLNGSHFMMLIKGEIQARNMSSGFFKPFRTISIHIADILTQSSAQQ